MSLKNYTSKVPVSRTISRIEEILSEMGAKAIGKNYEQGRVISIVFQLTIHGKDRLIRLPANPDAVYDVFRSETKKLRSDTIERLKEQAERTAWKIQQDWLEIELSLIQLNQKEPLQVFLSYLWDGTQTYFESLRGNGFKQLAYTTPERME